MVGAGAEDGAVAAVAATELHPSSAAPLLLFSVLSSAALGSTTPADAPSLDDLSSLQNNSATSSSSNEGPSDLGEAPAESRLSPSAGCCCSGSEFGGVVLWFPFRLSHSRRSYAILDAMFLKPILVPEMRLNRTPFRERRGNLHTSISHCTSESVLGSPWTHNRTNRSLCS